MKKLLCLTILIAGCASAYKAPVKVGKAILPPVATPILKTTAKATGYTIAEAVKLPVHVVKDTAKPAKKADKKHDAHK